MHYTAPEKSSQFKKKRAGFEAPHAILVTEYLPTPAPPFLMPRTCFACAHFPGRVETKHQAYFVLAFSVEMFELARFAVLAPSGSLLRKASYFVAALRVAAMPPYLRSMFMHPKARILRDNSWGMKRGQRPLLSQPSPRRRARQISDAGPPASELCTPCRILCF